MNTILGIAELIILAILIIALIIAVISLIAAANWLVYLDHHGTASHKPLPPKAADAPTYTVRRRRCSHA